MKACKICHRLTNEDTCSICHEPTSKYWYGYLIVIDPKNSKISKKVSIAQPGKYALKVR
ncbi:MAG TPA: DNA-directed RNA polymerase, subunit E'' [Thermoplasmata archaeon]|jgi:DNA-directed RNA polymerase subunit E"|nr:DNA-directed RNA polymerase, subunit E'' [Thermoplasmata archaeon]HIH98469.1 DNA-directed RNA polymerase, subunit E'' [Thermoplasmata archaeon]